MAENFQTVSELEFCEIHGGHATPRYTLAFVMRQALEPFILIARWATKAAGLPKGPALL